MGNSTLNTILSEVKNLNKHLSMLEKQSNTKFSLIDARFNTLEELVITVQKDIDFIKSNISTLFDSYSSQEEQYLKFNKRIRQTEIKIAKLFDYLSLSNS